VPFFIVITYATNEPRPPPTIFHDHHLPQHVKLNKKSLRL